VNGRRPHSEMDDRILGQKNRTGACLDKTLASSLTTAPSDYLPVTGSWYEYTVMPRLTSDPANEFFG